MSKESGGHENASTKTRLTRGAAGGCVTALLAFFAMLATFVLFARNVDTARAAAAGAHAVDLMLPLSILSIGAGLAWSRRAVLGVAFTVAICAAATAIGFAL